MRFTVYSSGAGIPFIDDVRLKVFLKPNTGVDRILNTLTPGSVTTENNQAVYTSQPGGNPNTQLDAIIDHVEIDSSKLGYLIFGVFALTAALITWYVSKR